MSCFYCSHHRESSSTANAAASSSQSEHRRHKRKADEALASSDAQVDNSESVESDQITLKEVMKDFFPVYSNKAVVFNVPGDTEVTLTLILSTTGLYHKFFFIRISNRCLNL